MNSLTFLKFLVEGLLLELALNCRETGASCFSPKTGLPGIGFQKQVSLQETRRLQSLKMGGRMESLLGGCRLHRLLLPSLMLLRCSTASCHVVANFLGVKVRLWRQYSDLSAEATSAEQCRGEATAGEMEIFRIFCPAALFAVRSWKHGGGFSGLLSGALHRSSEARLLRKRAERIWGKNILLPSFLELTYFLSCLRSPKPLCSLPFEIFKDWEILSLCDSIAPATRWPCLRSWVGTLPEILQPWFHKQDLLQLSELPLHHGCVHKQPGSAISLMLWVAYGNKKDKQIKTDRWALQFFFSWWRIVSVQVLVTTVIGHLEFICEKSYLAA